MALPALLENTLPDKDCYTEAEYFAWEDQAPGRWEFRPDGPPDALGRHLGQIRAMSGGTPDHSAIASNLGTALTNALRAAGNQLCRVFNSDLKVHCGDGVNTFPDVSVVCGALNFYGRRRDVVINPLLLVEVLSPSTAADDRGDKWASYQTIPALQHYLLVSADRARVELYTRENTGWHFEAWEGLDAHVSLPNLGVALALADVYALVDFQDSDV